MNKIEMISIPKTTYESSLALKRELVEALKRLHENMNHGPKCCHIHNLITRAEATL